ncbi:MAG: tetratricopeptide repeat protein [Acidobacteria bacterium]|nr:MAG: tetratricopeptide repeat protein [Acidobacteriota bacterium]
MSRDNLVFLLSGVFFGVLVGWILGSQRMAPAMAPAAVAAPAQGAGNSAPPPAPALDEARAAELQKVATAEPKNDAVRVELGNLYFDSERFDQAIPWYESALTLSPKNPDISTDLGTAYLYTQQTDKAIAQFEKSIGMDPKHLKTWLNLGIAKAMVKGDTAGGEAAWKKVIEIAPGSEEAKRAQQGIDALKGGHKGAAGG